MQHLHDRTGTSPERQEVPNPDSKKPPKWEQRGPVPPRLVPSYREVEKERRGRCDEEQRSFKMTLSNLRRGLAAPPPHCRTPFLLLSPSKLRILAVAFISHRRFNKTLQSVDLQAAGEAAEVAAIVLP